MSDGSESTAPVRYERVGSAALITIDRQHRRNAVDGPTAQALHEAYLRFEEDGEARALVLTGAGGIAFCAGADLKATHTFADRLSNLEGPMGFTRLTASKPTIAAISGFCLAGGLELALWCDLRIAAEGSTLGYPERRWGVPLIDGGTQRLPRIVGLGRALDLILTGRMIGAEEALAIGLLNEVVAPGAYLERALDKRPGKVYVLVRESSRGRLDDLITHWGLAIGSTAAKRVEPVHGDLRGPLLGLEQEQVAELRGKVVHFFHLAAVYDMTAPAELNTAINVGGTAHAVELARALEVDHLHHVSSIAVAGEYRGLFEEGFFDERQKLPSPYHRTKFEAERIVREQPYVPWRVYRPAIVVGDSQTGEMDKIDGPYYFFKAIQRMRQLLPEWTPLVGVDLGNTNVVPVDWVVGALEHIAHEPDLDGDAFHLTDPRRQRVVDVINELAVAAHAPRFVASVDKRFTDPLPKWPLALTLDLPPWRQLRKLALRELGIPEEVLAHMELVPRFDTHQAGRALAGTPFEQPPLLHEYAGRLWDYWEREM